MRWVLIISLISLKFFWNVSARLAFKATSPRIHCTVVAIRALRLRSNVTEVTQYYSRNIPDAESWLNVLGQIGAIPLPLLITQNR